MYEDYEERYSEALDVVRCKLKDNSLSLPEMSPHGIRFIHLDGMLCTDEMIFRMAWGEATARAIMNQRRLPRL